LSYGTAIEQRPEVILWALTHLSYAAPFTS